MLQHRNNIAKKESICSLVAKLLATSFAPIPQATIKARKDPMMTILRDLRASHANY